MTPPDMVLILPCYRDGSRVARYLPGLCLELARCPGLRVCVVDDGSPASEQAALAELIASLRRQHDFLDPLFAYPTNRGKGHAIRTGWDAARAARILAFVDADGAVPAPAVAAFLTRARTDGTQAIHIAERTDPSAVKRIWLRHVGSRLYNRWVRWWLGLNLPDTQCGLKAVPAGFYRGRTWREDQFAFDLELLLTAEAAGVPVVRQPIPWAEKSESKLGVFAIFSLFVAAVRLRRR